MLAVSQLIRTISFITIWLFCAVPLLAQRITHLGGDQGINGRQVFNIVQDKKKFVWISTRFGVDRFDGLNIKNYPMNILFNGKTPIRTIKVGLDRDSALWAYTDRGTVYKYDARRDEFICFKDLDTYLRSLCFDAGNGIWAITGKGVEHLVGNKLQLQTALQLSKGRYRAVSYLDKEHLLLVSDFAIYKYNIKTATRQPVIKNELLEKEGLSIETCLFDPYSNRLWVGTSNKGLFVYDIAAGTLRATGEQRLWFHPVLSLASFNSERLLVGTDGLGAYLLDTKTFAVEKFYNQLNDTKNRINGNVVYDIYKDAGGKVWLSTFTDGLNILDFSDQGFHVIQENNEQPNSLTNSIVCDLLEDTDGKLWLATNNDLSFWNKNANKWQRVLNEKNVLTLFEDSRKHIWVGTYSSGVYEISKQGAIINHYIVQPGNENSIGTNFIYAICEDAEGNMWFGGRRGAVSRLSLSNNTFLKVPVEQVNHMMNRRPNTILVSTELGVHEINTQTGKSKECLFNKNLKSRYISDMYLESDSIIWLASYGNGLDRCNLLNGTVTTFTQENGLPSDIIYAIERDDNNNLWLSSENGIGCFNLSTHKVSNFSIADGISGNRFRQCSKAKSIRGDIYFGSYSGVTYFNPREVKKRANEAHLSLQGLRLFNKMVKPGDKDAPLKQSLDSTSAITLNYQQHSFSIDFVAIDYSLGKARRYVWMLENMDKNWVGPTTEHIANYTNLSPNDYVFKVKYLDDSNNVIDEREIKITVTPPFWKTAWARIILLVILLIAAWFIYKYAQQKLEEKQTEEKIRFFINTAHDIRTPLTLIGAPIYELKEQLKSSPQNNYLMSLVTDNLDRLNKMFSQLLDFQKAYEAKDQLVIKKQDLRRYLSNKLIYWQSAAASKGLSLEMLLPDEELIEWFDLEKMDKILDNLMSNATKYTPAGGKITITLSADKNSWQLKIADTGIGISKQDRKNLFKRFYRAGNAINKQITGSGLGLMLVEKYVALHNGSIEVSSAENQGTEFCMQFKRGNKHFHDTVVLDDHNLPVLGEKELQEEHTLTGSLKMKLLVVEDNEDLRSFLKLSLGHYYTVYTAENGRDAWDNMLKINPDIIVSDLHMPEMDGFQLCEKVKSTFETSHIPVILLTVASDKQFVEKGLHLGADDYIGKPFDAGYLRLKIDAIIQNRKLLRQKFLAAGSKEQPETTTSGNELNDGFLENATAVVEKNMANPAFSVNDFARELALSRTLLYTKCNAITGFSPNDFIKIVRMKKAITCFQEKKYSINEVALMVGFDEPAYFSTCFRKIYGKSPKKFIEEDLS
ncbi:hybrid sensor histidine kinase/response regulator transcription factor [Filimonas effusa]|nr:two-component regulator propeller domain-containing protein [Filimonas effusa]